MSRKDDDFVTFTADMLIFDVLMHGPEVREAFRRLGLKCVKEERGLKTEYCVAAERERMSLTGLYHDQDLRAILAQLNALRVRPLTLEEKEQGGR